MKGYPENKSHSISAKNVNKAGQNLKKFHAKPISIGISFLFPFRVKLLEESSTQLSQIPEGRNFLIAFQLHQRTKADIPQTHNFLPFLIAGKAVSESRNSSQRVTKLGCR